MSPYGVSHERGGRSFTCVSCGEEKPWGLLVFGAGGRAVCCGCAMREASRMEEESWRVSDSRGETPREKCLREARAWNHALPEKRTKEKSRRRR